VAQGVGEAQQLLIDYHAAAHAGQMERMRLSDEMRDGGCETFHFFAATSLQAMSIEFLTRSTFPT
jgi:hypothetical protein